MLWAKTLMDVFGNALEEHMERGPGAISRWFQASPTSRGLLWVLYFSLAGVIAFLFYRLTVANLFPLLEELLAVQFQVGAESPVIWFLNHGLSGVLVSALYIASAQALVLRPTRLSSLHWFIATLIGWSVGWYLPRDIWNAVRPYLTLVLHRHLPTFLPFSQLIVESLITGLVLGFAQMWVLRENGQKFYLWPLYSILGMLVYYFAAEFMISRGSGPVWLRVHMPILFYGLVIGMALALLLIAMWRTHIEQGRISTRVPTAD
ncbi:MAG: hypothetical protein ACLFWD_08455 [Anaerolineales bacterium]